MKKLVIIFLFTLSSLLLSNQTTGKELNLTLQEQEFLKQHPIIKVSSETDYPPFDFTTDDIPNGYSIDFINLLASKIGFKVEYVTDSWGNLVKKIRNKEIDLIHTLKRTDEREVFLSFTDEIIRTNQAIFTRETTKDIKSYKDFKNRTIGLVKGEAVTSDIENDTNKNFNVRIFDSYDTLIEALSYGKIDAIVLDVNVGNYYIKKNDLYNVKVTGDINTLEGSSKDRSFRIAVRKDYPILKEILNKGIKSLPHSQIQQLKAKWFGTYNQSKIINVGPDAIVEKVSITRLMTFQEILFALLIVLILIYFTYLFYTKSNVLSIRFKTFNMVIIAFELFIITFLVYEIITLDRSENTLANTYKDKVAMLQVADELRQSSDDLTHFARSYAVTNNELFLQRYLSTLKIRNGEKARPLDYNLIYWDLEKSIRDKRHPLERKESLQERIQQLPFSKLELAKLKESEDNSNDLVNIEIKAFDAIKNNNSQLAVELLHSPDYYKEKHKIMLPVDEMLKILSQRLKEEIGILNQKIHNQFRYILVIGLLFILGNIVIYILLKKKVTVPIEYIADVIDKIQKNQKNILKETFYNDEIGETIEQFFVMKNKIDKQTKDLNKQKEFVQTILDSQEQIILTTDGTSLRTANETFFDFFAVDSIEDFMSEYNSNCICDTFNTKAPEGYLQIKMGEDNRESWIDYVISRSFGEIHKAMISMGNTDFIFSVTAAKLPGDNGLKSAVFTDITEMENAKNQIEEKLNDLNRFQRLAVKRELKMIELKEEINQSLQEKGENPKYKIVEVQDDTANNTQN